MAVREAVEAVRNVLGILEIRLRKGKLGLAMGGLENDVVGNGHADPAVNGGPVFHQLAYATCPYLLNYPDAGGFDTSSMRSWARARPS